MIIKLPLMLHNIVSKQFKISHVPCDVIAFKKEDIPEKISKLIVDQYDEKFLEDCDIVMFIKGPIDKDMRKKIFKACDKALGEGANMMNETDFRLLKLKDDDNVDFDASEADEEEQKIDDQVKEIVDEPDEEEQKAKETDDDDRLGLQDNDDAIADSLKESDDKDADEDEEDSDEDEDDANEDSDEDDDNEDDTSDETSDEVEVPTRYVFLKISMKS